MYVVLDARTVADLRACFGAGPAPPDHVYERLEQALIDALAEAVDAAQARLGRPIVENRRKGDNVQNGSDATQSVPPGAQLTIVVIDTDRVQVIDGRGHYLAGFASSQQAEAFLDGYVRGRQDAAAIVHTVAQALEQVSAR